MAEKPKLCLDACCFIDAAKQAIGILPTARSREVWHLWKLWEANKEGDVVLFTSMMAVVECIHAGGNMDTRVKGLFSRLLMSGDYVRLVQPTPHIAEQARDLRWSHGINLRGADYLYVASAIDRGCTEFLTTDEKVLNQAGPLEILGLRVTPAAETALLPDSYRQEDMLTDDKITAFRRQGEGSGS